MDYTKIVDLRATSTAVWVTAEFAHLHHWPDAPAQVAYLRHPHRHLFKVKLTALVNHDDRQVEFLQLKANLEQFIFRHLLDQRSTLSCEQMAELIALGMMRHGFQITSCEVSEDGENGAIKTFFYQED